MRSFLEICKATGTDKVIKHNYHHRYPIFFEAIRNNEINIFEMGVAAGKSIRMWEEYFPNAKITGLDLKPRYEFVNSEKVFIYTGDQRNERLLVDIVKTRGPFDIIIDDAGHRMPPQQIAFKSLFPTLKSNGWYVIEDTQTSYMKAFKGGYRHPNSTIELLKRCVDELHKEYIAQEDRPVETHLGYPYDQIDGIFFFEKIVFVRRKSEAVPQPFAVDEAVPQLFLDEPDSNS